MWHIFDQFEGVGLVLWDLIGLVKVSVPKQEH